MSYHALDPSYKGFLKVVKTGHIYPVFERDTLKNVELTNIELKKKRLEHMIERVVSSKEEYDKYMGIKEIKPKVEKVEEVKEIKEVKEVKAIKKPVKKVTRKKK